MWGVFHKNDPVLDGGSYPARVVKSDKKLTMTKDLRFSVWPITILLKTNGKTSSLGAK
mgnify:CR=1 FL=1